MKVQLPKPSDDELIAYAVDFLLDFDIHFDKGKWIKTDQMLNRRIFPEKLIRQVLRRQLHAAFFLTSRECSAAIKMILASITA